MSEFEYAGKILKVDLSDRHVTMLSTSDYSGRFVGGRGIATNLYWVTYLPRQALQTRKTAWYALAGR